MMALGYHGPLLLEDAYMLSGMMLQMKRAVPPSEWVDELKAEAESRVWAGFGV